MRDNATVILGESFSTNIAIRVLQNVSSVIDIWEGGSTLYGWDVEVELGNRAIRCIDRVPILVSDWSKITSPYLPEVSSIAVAEVDTTQELVGTTEGYEGKFNVVGSSTQRNWVRELYGPGKKFIPRYGWCNLFRRILRNNKSVNRVYGEIKCVSLRSKEIKVINESVSYSKIINSLPLPYLIKKLRVNSSNEFKDLREALDSVEFRYGSLFIVTLLAKAKYANNEVKLLSIGKKGYMLSDIVIVPIEVYTANESSPSEFTVIYLISPVALGSLRPELDKRLMSEAKKVAGIRSTDVIAYRSHFEKYALLGESGHVEEVLKALRNYGIVCIGRLGTWREQGIEDIIKDVPRLLLLSII